MAQYGANATNATYDKQDILVGAASVYLGPAVNDPVTANTAPAFAVASYRDTLEASNNWRNVGYTMEGLEVAYEPDYAEVEVDQLLDSAFLYKQAQKVTINTTFAQATLLNLMVAWGQADSSLTSTASDATLVQDGGSLGSAPVERGLIAVGNGNFGRGANSDYSERAYQAFRVLQVESSTYSMKRNEPSGVPVSFRALPANNGKYGFWKDRKKTW